MENSVISIQSLILPSHSTDGSGWVGTYTEEIVKTWGYYVAELPSMTVTFLAVSGSYFRMHHVIPLFILYIIFFLICRICLIYTQL